MCVYSMIMDHKHDEWHRRYIEPAPRTVPLLPQPALPTQAELEEFRRLLERAREYDRRNNEPACEEEEKKKRLKELADLLGVKIEFV